MSTETCPVCFADTDPVVGHECMAGWSAVKIEPTPSRYWIGKQCRHCGRVNVWGDGCVCRQYAKPHIETGAHRKIVLPGGE